MFISFICSFRKLRDVLQLRVIRFLLDQSKKEPEKYSKFFEDYSLFMREGIVTTQEQDVKVTFHWETASIVSKKYTTSVTQVWQMFRPSRSIVPVL